MSHFEPEAWREFLEGGHVRKAHDGDIPIWAGFLITQIADLRNTIGALLMTQAISLHTMFQGDMTQIQNAFNQLVAANTAAQQNAQKLLDQIAALQAKVTTPDADPVTSDDLAQMNALAAQIQQAAASTITTITPAPATPPATTAPATPDSGTTTGTDAGAASPSVTSPATAPAAAAAPDTTAPATTAPAAPTANSSSQPFKVNAGDTGAGA
ncbi:hypothetical protein [Nocardia sp. NPDC046763]|uniref:hypothetical protein n=1 Tax=Nocardia sp. NPDC046763 TaxID=3155256 RepID=UPI0033ED31D2